MDRRFELADIIYIFYSKDKPGIKFYDRSAYQEVEPGYIYAGKFETDRPSISLAKWDDEENKENFVERKITRRGEVIIKTFMVSPEQYLEITNSIVQQKEKDKIMIEIKAPGIKQSIIENIYKDGIDYSKYNLDNFYNKTSDDNNFSFKK